MRFAGRRALVTGAGTGIGRAIARALAEQGARVVVADIDAPSAQAVASEIDGFGIRCDVSSADEIATCIERAESAVGGLDILVSNAGFASGTVGGACASPDELWQQSWDVHVMAHLRASRLVLPGMIERGEGWLINVASAAGLLNQIGDAAYSATKHAAVSLAQSLAIEHAEDGIRVSVVCPLYVATGLLGYDPDDPKDRPNGRVLTPETVAESVMAGLLENRFLILPHPEAATYFRRRAEDTDGWIEGMRRLRRGAFADGPPADLSTLHRKI